MSRKQKPGVSRVPECAELYEDAACGLLVTSADGVIRAVNRTFCAWMGYAKAELVDHVKVQGLFTMGGRIFHQTNWAPLLQLQGSVSEVKLDMIHRDGRKLPMVLNAVRRDRDGDVLHELAVFAADDRTKFERELIKARHHAEELLAKEQAAQSALSIALSERDRQQALAQERALFAEQMMAIVSHDLRNPLSVINTSVRILGLGELNEKQQVVLSRLERSNARATRLIGDLLDFSQARLGAGLSFELRALDFHAVVAEGIEDLRMAFPKCVLVHDQVGDGPCSGSADRLTQLIGNLVANAAVYGAADRPITIVSTVAESRFAVSVHNHGEAIPAALLDELFAPMRRGAAIGEELHSVGLGLFIVREIARGHNGTVAVASSVEDGTTFIATFPRTHG